MTQGIYTILENRPLTASVWQMRLGGDTAAITRPGQFVNIRLEGRFLRRPISVCDWREGEITLVYKVVGAGTAQMAAMRDGTLDLLVGLGNGYDTADAGEAPLLIGGGVGVPPLYGLARRLIDAGRRVSVILGFNTAAEIFYEKEFAALGASVTVATADGSAGVRGFVTDAMKCTAPYTYFYTCGPEPMLRAVYAAAASEGQFSFEERMGCGFGACMGCSCRTVTGYKRICREGPVLRKEEILWEK